MPPSGSDKRSVSQSTAFLLRLSWYRKSISRISYARGKKRQNECSSPYRQLARLIGYTRRSTKVEDTLLWKSSTEQRKASIAVLPATNLKPEIQKPTYIMK